MTLAGAPVGPVIPVSDLAAARRFMRDDELPFDADERGIAAQDGMAVAWMRDPDSNVITLFELE